MMKADQDDDGSSDDNHAAGTAAAAAGRPTATADTAPKEGFMQKISRGFANCCSSTGLCCVKLKEQTQISALEYKIAARQKKFGVDYLTLVERKAAQAALKGCLKEALRDISELQAQVNDHYDKIDEKKGVVQQKQEEGAASSAPASESRAAAPAAKPKPKRGKPGNAPNTSKKAPAENKEGGADGTKKAPTKKKSIKKKKKTEGQDERFTIDE